MVVLFVVLTFILFLTIDYFVQRAELRKAATAGVPSPAEVRQPELVRARASFPVDRLPRHVFFDPGHTWIQLESSGMLRVGEDVYQILRTIAEQPGIERIRIFNKEGRIIYSTDIHEIGRVVDKRAELCYACHSSDQPLRHLDHGERIRIFAASDGNRLMGLINPVTNEEECYTALCHAHPEDQQILGVLDINMSLASVDRKIAAGKERIQMITYLTMFFLASISGLFLWIFVHLPVMRLLEGTKRLSSGEFSYTIPVRSRNEIGVLAESFNQMSRELAKANTALLNWAKTLEEKVEEKTRTLRQAQAKLIQSEKMASLGSLAAIVAHEINNPLSGVLTYTKLVQKMLTAHSRKCSTPAEYRGSGDL